MKANSLLSTIKSGAAAALVVGMLAAVPAYAFPSSTHGHNYYDYLAKKATQKVASQAKPGIQVAVMAESPSQPTANTPKGDIWFGSSPRSHATHSH